MSLSRASNHTLQVQRTARWWSLDPPEGTTVCGTLFVLHGYGQLAEYFIRKFQSHAQMGWRVIAPEGAHRFYLKGTEGRVGASWMTKEERMSDVEDYVQFLDQIRMEVAPLPTDLTVLLGFSQGVATAIRWAVLGQGGANAWTGLIAHSGVIPPDLGAMNGTFQHTSALHLITGRQDPYIQDEGARFTTAEQAWSNAKGAQDRLFHHWFEGGHDIDAPTVSDVLDGFRA